MKKYYRKLPFWFKLWWAKQLLHMFKGLGSTFVNDIVLFVKITEMIDELELWLNTKGRPSTSNPNFLINTLTKNNK